MVSSEVDLGITQLTVMRWNETGSGQLAPKTTRPKTTRPTFRRQLAPHSGDNSPHSEDNSPLLVLTCFNLKMNLNSFRRPINLHLYFAITEAQNLAYSVIRIIQVIEKQSTGTGPIKRQIPLLKPKREINKYYK